MDFKSLELWFVTGSQHLYGPETLKKVAEDSRLIARALDGKEKDCGDAGDQKSGDDRAESGQPPELQSPLSFRAPFAPAMYPSQIALTP